MKDKIFLIIIIIFLLSRLLGLDHVYHQDEYKWAVIVSPLTEGNINDRHPPLSSLLYHWTGEIFGYDYLRLLPILASFFILLLTYAICRKLYGRRAALWTAVILLLSTYFYIASLQIDIDGALLPFFILLAVYAYYNIDFNNLKSRKNHWWYGLLFLSIVGGFLTKLSFVIVVVALITEYFLQSRPNWRKVFKIAGISVGAILTIALFVFLVHLIYPALNAEAFLQYVKKFNILNFVSRRYSQLLFLTVKSLVVASPLLLAGYLLLFSQQSGFKKYRFWLIFLLYNFLFYFIIFDFTQGGTIERYLMFLIVPGTVIIGSLIADNLKPPTRSLISWLLSFSAIFILLSLIILNLPHKILPLIPKSAYLSQIKNLDFAFLIPITGGSGPSGFYVSVLYIIIFFAIAVLSLVIYCLIKNKKTKQLLLLTFITSALIYNVVLNSEFLFGLKYGRVTKLTKDILTYVVDNPEIDKIVTYYDVGGWELNQNGKYANRFYTNPMFWETNMYKFASAYRFFLVVDFPEINKDSIYWHYFNTCSINHQLSDKKISAYLFDCSAGDFTPFKDNIAQLEGSNK